MACPTKARLFGDLSNPDDPATRHATGRGAVDLYADLGYQPTNRYLPPKARPPHADPGKGDQGEEDFRPEQLPPILRWLDRVLSR